MTKKKHPEEQSADFKNNPFKTLKGFAPSSRSASNSAKPARNKTEQTGDEEKKMFLQAAAGVRTLHEVDPLDPTPVAGTTGSKEPTPALPDKDLFLQAMRRMGAVVKSGEHIDEDFPGAAGRSKSSRMKQLKRGVVRISSQIDLHGYVREEALVKLARFIAGAYGAGEGAVLVITGKGINSPEGPVLQGAVTEWLRTKGKGEVAEFAPAPREKGGSGAFVVFLRKKQYV